jgi:hypothetical protein
MTDDQFRKRHWILAALVGTHFVFVSILFLFSYWIEGWIGKQILGVVRFSLLLSQSSLLGIWGGLGVNNWLIRLLGVGAAFIYLYLLIETTAFGYYVAASSTWLFPTTIDYLVGPTVFVSLVLLVIRRIFARLVCDGNDVILEGKPKLQFSIRQLMLLMLCVCLAMPAGIKLWAAFDFSPNGFIQICLSSSWGLIALPAALGREPTYRRCGIALSLAAVCGLEMEYLGDFRIFPWAMGEAILSMIILLATLLVVRNCGYRLVRIKHIYGI